mmetsp:Transcript_10615/g.17527  ORF Transcript_10615/g.17527 Transcript_10615/m.17527 type:complete len:551 (+) Transcript_10615:115-1767(+)
MSLPYSQHPGMMPPERAAGIWHEPAGDGYQWVDGPGQPPQPAAQQAPPQPIYPTTQPQAGTQWVDNPTNPTPPPVQDMVYQWVDSPSYGRPPAPAAPAAQPYVQAPTNPYYPGVDPYGALPRPMDPMALQPGIDPLRPPVQGLDPIAAQYQAGLAYGADANRYQNPQAGMAPYAPRQPLGMDDLTSIRMGGKGVPNADFGQAGYSHETGGKRGKGQNGTQRRQVDDGRGKGRQVVPPGRQVDTNKAQVDAGQAALESLGPDGLRQMLISTLESLYEDRIKPMSNYIKGRLKERSVPDIIVKSFEDLYTQHPDLFEVQNPKSGEETTIYFHKPPAWFKGWIDIDSPQDPYDESMWKEFAKFLDGEHTFAGGRYGMARELMQRHLPFLANHSLGEVCHIVQLAIQHRRLIVYHRKMLKPIQTVLCQLSPDGTGNGIDTAEGEEIKDMDDLTLALFRMLLHHPSGIRLCRMKQMIKHEFQRKLSEMAFQCTKLIELFNQEPLNETFVLDTENDGKSIYVRLGNPDTFSDHVKRIYAMANSAEAKQALPGLSQA